DLLLADDQGEWAVELEVAPQDVAADFDEVALAVEFACGGWRTEDLADVDAVWQFDFDIGDDFSAWVIDLEHGQPGQCGVEDQRRHRELGADWFDAAPFDSELVVVLRECEAAAGVDVVAVEEVAQLLPDLDHSTRVLDAVDQIVLVGELIDLEFGH